MKTKITIAFILLLMFQQVLLANVEIGQYAPEINLPSPLGKNVNLKALKGNIVLVDFWASWCSPCRASNPALVKIYEEYATNGFEIVSISLDEDKVKWQNAIKQDQLSWEGQACDLKGWDSKVVTDYGVQALPTQYLIDREGKIVAIDLSLEELADELEHLLINEAAVYPQKTSSILFMNVFIKYEITSETGKKVLKGIGNEIDVSTLPLGKYNIVIAEKDHWFEKVEMKKEELSFYPKNVSTLIKINKSVPYEISNLKGETVLSGLSSEVDVSKLHIGVYYIKMGDFVGKFLKK